MLDALLYFRKGPPPGFGAPDDLGDRVQAVVFYRADERVGFGLHGRFDQRPKARCLVPIELVEALGLAAAVAHAVDGRELARDVGLGEVWRLGRFCNFCGDLRRAQRVAETPLEPAIYREFIAEILQRAHRAPVPFYFCKKGD